MRYQQKKEGPCGYALGDALGDAARPLGLSGILGGLPGVFPGGLGDPKGSPLVLKDHCAGGIPSPPPVSSVNIPQMPSTYTLVTP